MVVVVLVVVLAMWLWWWRHAGDGWCRGGDGWWRQGGRGGARWVMLFSGDGILGVVVRAVVLEMEAKVGGSRGDGEGW